MTKQSIAIGDPISSASRLAGRAKERGYPLIELRTFSGETEYYSRGYNPALFDHVVEYSGDDAQALYDLRDAGHIIVGADSSIAAVEKLNLYRGLATNDPAKILARSDKVEQNRAFRSAGIHVVPQQYFEDVEEAVRYARDRGFPQVLKPRASGGTNNVRLARTEEQFRAGFSEIARAKSLYDRNNEGVLVMDYVSPESAEEIVVDAVSSEGRHIVTDVWAYEKSPFNGTPAMYRSMRTIPVQDSEREVAFAFLLLDAAGYRQGASHAEIWRLSDGSYLPVEVGFRLPGLITAISAEATGRDQVDLTLDSYVAPAEFGKKADFLKQRVTNRSAAIVFFAARDAGRLRESVPLGLIRRLKSFHSATLKATQAGDPIMKTVDVGTIAGWVGLVHDDATVVERDMMVLRGLEPRLTDVVLA